MATSSTHNGWLLDRVNERLAAVYGGAEVFDFSASDFAVTAAATFALGIVSAAGPITATAGDIKITAGNLRLGAIATFATTEPTSAVVMKAGTNAVGAIATSGAIFSNATVINKIIADGTVSTIQT